MPVWRVDEGRRGQVLEVCGTPVNLEMAAYVHAFLLQTAARLWREYRKERAIRSNRDRRAFQAGVMNGFHDRLVAERKRHVEVGLVWVGDADLRRFLRKRHPYIRSTSHGGRPQPEAHAHGREKGRALVLCRPIAAPSQGAVRLLRS